MSKSNFKLDFPNYTITHNDRPRRQEEDVAILVHNTINFGFVDTCSSFDSDKEAIIIILKDL